jgi:hypothetical protein
MSLKALKLKASAYLADLEDSSLLLETYEISELPDYFKMEAHEIIRMAAEIEE